MTAHRNTAAALALALAAFNAWAAGPALPDDIVDASRAIVPAAYVAMAAQMSQDAGIAYRYGPQASGERAANGGLPTWYQRPDNTSRHGVTRWQVGGPRRVGDATNDQTAAGSYLTNQANVLFVADDPGRRIGVSDIQVSGYEFNTFAQLPQLSWTMTGAPGAGIDSLTALDYKPQQTPVVVKTVSLPARPTAVRTTLFGRVPRAWVATQDGTLRIYSLGGYAPGSSPASPVAVDIADKGSVAIGRNPTSLAISKAAPDDPNIEPLNQQVLVASRGERKIQWVRFAADGNSGKVVRTLQDTRIVDPVAVEDAENFATAGHILSIADYAGKAVSNFRYGNVVFADRGPTWACQPPGCGMGADGRAPFEFGGSMAMPGKPFRISSTNVP